MQKSYYIQVIKKEKNIKIHEKYCIFYKNIVYFYKRCKKMTKIAKIRQKLNNKKIITVQLAVVFAFISFLIKKII